MYVSSSSFNFNFAVLFCIIINNNCGKTMGRKLNGVDRVDSAVGYSESNCVSCCATCNMMKIAMFFYRKF